MFNILKRQIVQPLVNLCFNSIALKKSSVKLGSGNYVYLNRPTRRLISTTQHNHSVNEYTITFVKANGDRVTAKGKEGETLLDVVVNNNLDFDGFGACEGTLTCSTCHCIFKQEDYDRLPEKPSDEELDMLDLAYELSDTSRLGCQIQLSKDLNGVEVRLPSTLNDARG